MKVLIPVDGSEQSLRTIEMAARFLDKSNAKIFLLTIIVPAFADMPTTSLKVDVEAASKILQAAEQKACNVGLKIIDKERRTDMDPAASICLAATEKQVDLIIMGSHGHFGLTKLLLGGISERVFKQAEQPVIILRNDKEHTVEISHFEKAGLKQTQ